MNKREKLQWHAPFCAAAMLALRDNPGLFDFEEEHQLSKKALEPDLLILKKRDDIVPKNPIAKLFRRYNIIEYKSPKDALNIDTFFKVLGYASLYKSFGTHVNERKATDITMTLVRERIPRTLFRVLKQDFAFTLTERYPGVWHLAGGNIPFPAQFICTKALADDANIWLRCLTQDADQNLVKDFFSRHRSLRTQGDVENADAVLSLLVSANKAVIHHTVKEDPKMITPLMARLVLEDELNEKDEEIREAREEVNRLTDENLRLREQLAALQGNG